MNNVEGCDYLVALPPVYSERRFGLDLAQNAAKRRLRLARDTIGDQISFLSNIGM
jgi:hypothetical protein